MSYWGNCSHNHGAIHPCGKNVLKRNYRVFIFAEEVQMTFEYPITHFIYSSLAINLAN